MAPSERAVITFYNRTINHIQSSSMKEWAQTAHNKPIILQAITTRLTNTPKAKPQDFATFLTLVAMG